MDDNNEKLDGPKNVFGIGNPLLDIQAKERGFSHAKFDPLLTPPNSLIDFISFIIIFEIL